MADTMEDVLRRLKAEERGGYWCSDGEHYTFGSFLSRSCCDSCQAAVDAYCDRMIW